VAACSDDLKFSWSNKLCHYYLQKCHYWCRITKMPLLGLKCWPIHLDDVEMTWKWCENDVSTLFNWIL